MIEYNAGADDAIQSRFKVFTLEFVIKKFIDYSDDQSYSKVRALADWELLTTENILKSLLKNNMDKIATECVKTYLYNADKPLLIFALFNYNEIFLK